MLYQGQISSLNGTLYTINIITGQSTEPVDIMLAGDDPVIIESKSEFIFDPIKSRSCSINIVSDRYYMDLYRPEVKDARVIIYDNTDNDNIIFKGYLEPNIYDMGYSYLDVITLEAVDGLSTLKDYKFQSDGKYKCFFDIIISLISSAGYTGTLYIPKTYSKLNGTTLSDDLTKIIYAASANFIDNDEEQTPWTNYEVLSEIMQFLGWSAIPVGNDVWLVDYNARINDTVEYYKYNIYSEEYLGTYTNNSSAIHISKDTILAPGSSNISIDDIYSKIEISDNLYDIEEIAPNVFDSEYHISINNERQWGPDYIKWSHQESKYFLWWTWGEHTVIDGYDYQTICRLDPDSGWTHHWYRHSNQTEVENYYDVITDDTNTYKNAFTNKYMNTHGALITHYTHLDSTNENIKPASLDWTDVISFFMLGPNSPKMNYQDLHNLLNYKVLEYDINEEIQWKPITGTSYITFKGDLFYQRGGSWDKDGGVTIINADKNYYTTFPIDKTIKDLPSDRKYMGLYRNKDNQLYGLGFEMLRMRVQIGEGANAKYWKSYFDTETRQYYEYWTSDPSDFYIRYNNGPTDDGDEFIPEYQWVSMVNNKDYKDKVGIDGYVIPIDSSDNTAPNFGKLKITVYGPTLLPEEVINMIDIYTRPNYGSQTGGYTNYSSYVQAKQFGFTNLPPVIYMKDFEIGYVYTDSSIWWDSHDINKEDKVYTGYIDENYKLVKDDIEFKLNTMIPDKPISKSYVTTENNGYLMTLRKSISNEDKIQEYNIIDNYLDHYSERKTIYEVNLYTDIQPDNVYTVNNLEGNFILDSYSWDLNNDKKTCKLIQF